VTVHERRAWGGKARSTQVPNSASGGRKPLPGEHGWRIFFGFYQNTVDTMRRVPWGSNQHGVFDNLVAAPQVDVARQGARDLVLPLGQLDPRPYTPREVVDLIVSVGVKHGLPPRDVARFAARMVVYFSSCQARRLGEWENTRWTDFTQADKCTLEFRREIINAVSQEVQASKAENTAANFSARVFEIVVYSLLGFGSNGPTFRIFDRPTNEAFIDPWLNVLTGLGVDLRLGAELVGWETASGRVSNAVVRDGAGSHSVQADWYISAMPVERARALWTTDMRTLDPALARMDALSTGWMNGLKIFLREPRPIVRGHVYCADSPWFVGTISQSQFWPFDFASTYGDGTAHESLSVIISNWNSPGVVFGKPATDCTPEEIVHEAWTQLKMHINDSAPGTLTDDLIVSWNIDPGMIPRNGHLVSGDPLVLPAVHERASRPDVTTAIPNLLLCGDYLNGEWFVANMESASFNARRAVNAILDRTGSTAPRVSAIPPYLPPEWEPLKQIDTALYTAGQPNLFDNKALDLILALLPH
jgi:uncharacterized protein with NAD-binding domain and iron-sulfur cluster